MSAIDKTNALERKMLPVELLKKNAQNPNKMKPREFDLLVDNIQKTGITDPILVRALGEGEYRIVGGHHRFEAAVFLEFSEVPCTIITDPDFDDDEERFQIVRMNMIRGRMDPDSFFALYNSVSGKYSNEILQDAFGFADDAEFKKLVNQVAKQLPDETLQRKFKEAAKEIKTIDGLSRLLNEMFTKYGDTLPYGYMVFDHGGQRSVWLQVSDKTLKAMDVIGQICIEKQRTVDDLIGGVLQLMAKADSQEFIDGLVAETVPVELPSGMTMMPTKDNLANMAEFE